MDNNEVKLEGVTFEILDEDMNVVEEIITDSNGEAVSSRLPCVDRIWYVREKETKEGYVLSNEIQKIVLTADQITDITFENEREKKPDTEIHKTGAEQATANEEIRYDFYIKNTGNVALNNFTWYDYLPTEYVKIEKMSTGTYNQDLNYSVYYKTNLNDYRLLIGNLNTQVNNYINFTNIMLEEGEVITEFKVDFGIVNVGFESITNPYVFVRVKGAVQNGDIFTNTTRIEGKNKDYLVWDEDSHTTTVYERKISEKKLPRTGR